jgi:hypothetical protein
VFLEEMTIAVRNIIPLYYFCQPDFTMPRPALMSAKR